jgi:membrane-bound serine protease (ClpP class)
VVAVKHVLAVTLVILGFGGAIASQGVSTALADAPHAATLSIDGSIQPVTARFLSRAIDKGADDGAQLLIITLDTPGGLFDATRDMVSSLLNSSIPVVGYVYPSGARAASAGTFIAAAAHVAAMTPITTIGAASPVGTGGSVLPETLASKVKEDAAALIRSIAEKRGRNSEALEGTVLSAKSYSASEALKNNIIDLIANDLEDLLTQLDGRTVQLEAGDTVLQTDGLELRAIEKTVLEEFLGFLGNPTVAFMLLALGFIGIFLEFILGAGLILPATTGAIALALAFVAMGQLPVNWVGVALLGVSVLLFFFELHTPGATVFGVSAVISFALGAILLFGGFTLPGFTPPPLDAPSLRVNPWLIAGVTAGMAGIPLFLARSIMAARRPGTSGPTTDPTLEGQAGFARTDLAPGGTVHVAGEDWTAVSDSGDPISAGDEVIVVEAEGLTLKVFRSPESSGQAEEGSAGVEPASGGG